MTNGHHSDVVKVIEITLIEDPLNGEIGTHLNGNIYIFNTSQPHKVVLFQLNKKMGLITTHTHTNEM